jgi:hypothetical protein
VSQHVSHGGGFRAHRHRIVAPKVTGSSPVGHPTFLRGSSVTLCHPVTMRATQVSQEVSQRGSRRRRSSWSGRPEIVVDAPLELRPALTSDDLPGLSARDAELASSSRRADALLRQAPDGEDIFDPKPSARVRLTSHPAGRRAPLCHLVERVQAIGADEQVRGIAARRVVAAMAGELVVGEGATDHLGQHEARYPKPLTGLVQLGVALALPATGPWPASVRAARCVDAIPDRPRVGRRLASPRCVVARGRAEAAPRERHCALVSAGSELRRTVLARLRHHVRLYPTLWGSRFPVAEAT